MSSWAVIKIDVDKEAPTFKIIPTENISSEELLKAGTKLNVEAEIISIQATTKKAKDSLMLHMFRKGFILPKEDTLPKVETPLKTHDENVKLEPEVLQLATAEIFDDEIPQEEDPETFENFSEPFFIDPIQVINANWIRSTRVANKNYCFVGSEKVPMTSGSINFPDDSTDPQQISQNDSDYGSEEIANSSTEATCKQKTSEINMGKNQAKMLRKKNKQEDLELEQDYASYREVQQQKANSKSIPIFAKNVARLIFTEEECRMRPDQRNEQRMAWLKTVVAREFESKNSNPRINRMINDEIWKACMSSMYADATNIRNRKKTKVVKRKIIESDEDDDDVNMISS